LVANVTIRDTGQNRHAGHALIHVSHSSAAIERCRLLGAGGHGMEINNRAHVVVRDCDIAGSRQAGIFIEGATGLVENNTLRGNEQDGIRVRGCDHDLTLRDNRCIANGLNGILVSHGSGDPCGPTAEAHIRGNVCAENTGSGILCVRGAHVLAEGNTCERNHRPGIQLRDPDTVATLYDNHCRQNNHSGIIFLAGAGGIARGNTCVDNRWSGIATRDTGTDPALTANQCNNNGAWGIISWAGAQPDIAPDNVARDNWRGGVKHRSRANPWDTVGARIALLSCRPRALACAAQHTR
jgi:parallel beta-helix repeat protein